MPTASHLTTEEITITTDMPTTTELTTTEESTTITDMFTSSDLTTQKNTATIDMPTTSDLTTEENTATTDMPTTSDLTTEEITTTTELTTSDLTTEGSTTEATTAVTTSVTSPNEPPVSNPPVIITVPEVVPINNHINITAVIAVINVIVPVQFSMEFPVALASIPEYFSLIFREQVRPYYVNTEGFQNVEVTTVRQVNTVRRRRDTGSTAVEYVVEYDYKKLEEAGGVKTVTSQLEEDVRAGHFNVSDVKPTSDSLTHSTEEEIRAAAVKVVLEQVAEEPDLIEGGPCAVANCPNGYECQQDETTGDATCVTKCTIGYCHNNGTCFHVENQPVYCSCNHDPTGFYVGAMCEFYAPQAWVIGVSVGVGGFLIIIIIVVSVCRCRRTGKKDGDRRKEEEATWLSPVDKREKRRARDDSFAEELPLYTIANRKRASKGGRTNPDPASIVYGEEQMLGIHAMSGPQAENNYRTGWQPRLQHIPTDKELKIPRPGLYERRNNYWRPIDGRISVSST
ncbi:uncharacterized protein LOC144927632 [Branchiostoma floridae x Branchiostoma belcheri]